MKKALCFIFVFFLCSPQSSARIEVISSTCMAQTGHFVSWLKCPDDSGRLAQSLEEVKNNLVSWNQDQKYCCGPVDKRYCCDLEKKIEEDPRFDPRNYQSSDREVVSFHRVSERPSFFWTILWISLVFGSLFIVSYLCGGLIFSLIQCLCSCCYSKHEEVGRGKGVVQRPRRQGEHAILVQDMTRPAGQTNTYRTLEPDYVRRDLYQQVQRPAPPSYSLVKDT